MKKILNKWQLEFYFRRPEEFFSPGWRRLGFSILKLKSFPKEGTSLGKRHYYGFIFSFLIWFPIDIDRRYKN
jgi:hypothetical protein